MKRTLHCSYCKKALIWNAPPENPQYRVGSIVSVFVCFYCGTWTKLVAGKDGYLKKSEATKEEIIKLFNFTKEEKKRKL